MLDDLKRFLHAVHDVQGLIAWGGLGLICTIVFVETGLFIGFFLPGDSLLVTAGVFARAGLLDIRWLVILLPICAIVGDQVGYIIGHRAGEALYRWPDTWYFKKAHIHRTRDFYQKYGVKTIVIARFVPIIRTFAPAVAGVAQMDYRTFVTYNVVGGLLWTWSTVLGGYALASFIPDIDKKIHQVIVVVVILSVLPAVIEIWRERRRAAAEQR